MIVFLVILIYLLIGLIGASLVHRYFAEVESDEFIYMVILWPFVIAIALVFGGIDLLKICAEKYLKLIGKKDKS